MNKLWELKQYLSRMRDAQTVLVKFDGSDECMAFGFTKGYSLCSPFVVLNHQMAALGLDPIKRGEVYAYIERRAPAFVPDYYGWGVER